MDTVYLLFIRRGGDHWHLFDVCANLEAATRCKYARAAQLGILNKGDREAWDSWFDIREYKVVR